MKKLTIILTAFFLMTGTGLSAQNLNDAGKAYNKAIALAQENKTLEAIASYQKCADICAELGDVGEGLKIKAETQIYNLYLTMGVESYKAKAYDSAIASFTDAGRYAELINDPESTDKLNKYFAAAYTGKGNTLLKKTKYNDAIAAFNKAAEYHPSLPNAYYGLAICYSKLEDTGNLEESVNKVKEVTNDEDMIGKVNSIAATYYLKMSGKAIEAQNFNEARMMAELSIGYEREDPTAFYYLALSNNNLGFFGDAQKAATIGISMDQEDKSNMYFELGRAYEGNGDKENACSAYANVTSGPNMQAANYQRTQVLKCE